MAEAVKTPAEEGVDPDQAREGLLEDPVVEEQPDDVEAEDGEALAPPPPGERQAVPTIERVLAIAMTQQGMKERPCPSNDNKYSEYFGYGAQYWCADFVSWCVDRVTNRDKRLPWGYPSSCRIITEWAQRNDLVVKRPKRGDIFTYRNGGHIGFVTNVSGDTFRTIEGNTNGPDGTVCWVAQQTRSANDGRYHFIRYRP